MIQATFIVCGDFWLYPQNFAVVFEASPAAQQEVFRPSPGSASVGTKFHQSTRNTIRDTFVDVGASNRVESLEKHHHFQRQTFRSAS
jgi:hypothetical protein